MYIRNGEWDITADAVAIKKDNENIMKILWLTNMTQEEIENHSRN